MTAVLLVIAIILDFLAIALIAVVYRTVRDVWEKIAILERRLKKIERDGARG